MKNELVAPYVKLTQHPIKWTWNQIRTYGTSIILAHVGTLAVVALYYLLFELNPTMTAWWHHTVPNSNFRHDIRNVAEGLLGGLLVMAALYKKPTKVKPPNIIDKIEHFLHIPNAKYDKNVRWWEVVLMPIFVVLYASVGFAASYAALHYGHVHATQSANANLWESLWINGWDAKIMGFVASFFFGKRPAKGVMNHVQLFWVARRWNLGNDKPSWWWTPAYQARFNHFKDATAEKQNKALNRVRGSHVAVYSMVGGTLVLAALAGYGYYILKYIAKA